MSYTLMGLNGASAFFKNDSFIQQLYDVDAPSIKFSLLEKEVIKSGFDGVLYTFIPRLSLLSNAIEPVYQYSNTYQQRMIDYINNHTYRDDFIIRLIDEKNLDCINWWEHAEQKKLTKKEKYVNAIAREYFGIHRGITIPTLSNDTGIAFVNIISFSDDSPNQNLTTEILNHLTQCSQIYHDHVMTHQDLRYHFILPILKTLSPKKVILIKYLISGKPINCISKHADISTRYAEKLLIEIRKQFGNISTNELIYLLGRLNIPEYI